MSTITRRTTVAMIAGALVMIAALFSAGTASAQCNSVVVTNNLGCNLQLCLYSPTGVAPVCWGIPAGGPTVITFPAGFVPAGAVSSGGNRYAFGADGCTKCFSFTTTGPVRCCGVVCWDPHSCSITINPCTTPTCNP
jgi:hypothetical protein